MSVAYKHWLLCKWRLPFADWLKHSLLGQDVNIAKGHELIAHRGAPNCTLPIQIVWKFHRLINLTG